LALCLALACAAPAAAAALDVTPALQARLGVTTTVLKAQTRKAQVDAFAKVLDPGPLAQLNSDLLTAVAAAKASSAEAARSQALHAAGGSVAAKDAEAAQAQARSDRLKVELLRQRVGLEWGPGIARLSDAQRERLVEGLSAGRLALVHVDTPSNAGQAGAHQVKIDVGTDSVSGVVLGPARAAEPRLQSSGLIVEVSGASAILLSVGLTQSAHIESGSPQSGVILPRGALVRYQGATWAYVVVGPGRFERRLAPDGQAVDDGLFVASGFKPGEAVASTGVSGLFAADLARAPARTR
jgi:hypothetical protein